MGGGRVSPGIGRAVPGTLSILCAGKGSDPPDVPIKSQVWALCEGKLSTNAYGTILAPASLRERARRGDHFPEPQVRSVSVGVESSHSRSARDSERAKLSSPSRSLASALLRCCSSQIRSSTVPSVSRR